MNDPNPVPVTWPPAKKRRRLLAIYLDYLFFGTAWALALWALGKVLPKIEAIPPFARFIGFLLLEVMLLRKMKWSPGHELLGIRLRLSDAFLASKQESLLSGTLVVDPRLQRIEAWWTMLFGVLTILNGMKTAVRWTMFTPPTPAFGTLMSAEASVAIYLISGALEVLIGATALQMRWQAFPLSVGYFGAASFSAFLSRDLWPGWIEAYTRARRAYQGVAVRPGEIEMMQGLIPLFWIMPLALLLWGGAVWLRVRARRSAA